MDGLEATSVDAADEPGGGGPREETSGCEESPKNVLIKCSTKGRNRGLICLELGGAPGGLTVGTPGPTPRGPSGVTGLPGAAAGSRGTSGCWALFCVSCV